MASHYKRSDCRQSKKRVQPQKASGDAPCTSCGLIFLMSAFQLFFSTIRNFVAYGKVSADLIQSSSSAPSQLRNMQNSLSRLTLEGTQSDSFLMDLSLLCSTARPRPISHTPCTTLTSRRKSFMLIQLIIINIANVLMRFFQFTSFSFSHASSS